MNRRTERLIHTIAFLCFLMAFSGIICYGIGRASMREEIRATIKSQQVSPARVVKVPQLGLTLVPFDRGFLSWSDGNEPAVLARGGAR
jgi:hypothetical protein